MENNKLPTAKELCKKMHKEEPDSTSWIDFNQKAMIEFAKLHVEAALKEVNRRGKIKKVVTTLMDSTESDVHYVIDKESILNSYPLSKIK